MRRCYSLVGLLDLEQFFFLLDALGTRVLVCASPGVSLCRLQRRHGQVAQTFRTLATSISLCSIGYLCAAST